MKCLCFIYPSHKHPWASTIELDSKTWHPALGLLEKGTYTSRLTHVCTALRGVLGAQYTAPLSPQGLNAVLRADPFSGSAEGLSSQHSTEEFLYRRLVMNNGPQEERVMYPLDVMFVK